MTSQDEAVAAVKEEYLHLDIPLHKFSDREEIQSAINKSPLADKSKNDKALATTYAYLKKVLEEISFMQTGRYRELIMQTRFVKSR